MNMFRHFRRCERQPSLHIFIFPCMLISPQGVAVMSNAIEVESLLDKMMEGLKARGYARSELTDVEAIPLSEKYRIDER